ncbi:hypothetical protein DMC30DRAFT_399530 [Rhodotorula diobovata]|uniref:Uncharacterized protein n=1 Tax=Rhodotorula diobovata TaxID=5288 RepID=A0A5C5FU42_9BASI|nr:hypothetical protein DMC30DRAFT_399530 [Rhodotorula diobovata]
MAPSTAFASALGPLHHAHPSTAASHTLFGLFRSSSSSSDSHPSSCSRPTKRTKKASPLPLRISTPVLQSTTNASVCAPAYTAAFEAPRRFRRDEGDFPSSSSSSSSSASSERSASPPPPPYHRASFLDVDVEDDSDDSHLAVTALEDRPLVDAEQVERRMARWDAERRLCQEEEVLKVDGRMDTGLRLLGL